MRMSIARNLSVVLALVVVWGCESSVPNTPTAPGTASAPPPPAPAPPGTDEPAEDVTKLNPAAQPAVVQTPEAAAPDGNEPAEPAATSDDAARSEKAQAGVGAKGRDYGGPGFVTTPIETLFRIEDRIAFEIQIPKAMSLYKADHNNKGPKTQEEFMDVIIKEHGVQLPELPAGDVYWYDPQTEELMVRHPVEPSPPVSQ